MLDEELMSELKDEIESNAPGLQFMFISSVAQKGITTLKDKLWNLLNA